VSIGFINFIKTIDMKKNKKNYSTLSDIIPDKAYREKIEEGLRNGNDLLGPDGIFTELLQSLVNASLEGEMDHHLAQDRAEGKTNRRNGRDRKRVRSQAGSLDIRPPRDRNGTFEPVVVEKRKRELKSGLDEIIIAMYAKGNSVGDIHQMLYEIYGIEYSTSAISMITERVLTEIIEWQQRPLYACYSILYLDGMHFRVKVDGVYVDRCVYSVYAVDTEGYRDVLGIYLSENESASEWGLILEDIKRRGVKDILFISIDGLKGFKQAIEHVFPSTIVQRCIVHKIRNSVRFVADKKKKKLCKDLRRVYTAANKEQARQALLSFREKWGKDGKRIAESWEKEWDELMSFMDFGADIRRMIYTTNPVEALHRVIRKITKSKGAWISEKALTKQLYLALVKNEKSWKKKAYNFNAIQLELINKFGKRYSQWID
jgi:transposase-like protein